MVTRMKNRIATWIHMVLASLVAIGVFLQVYFIASFASGATDALDWHQNVGGIIHLAEVLVFLSGLVAFWGFWKWVGWSLLLPVLGTVQIGLAPDDDPSSGWVHGFHGLLALFVLILAAILAHRDMRLLGLKGGADAAPAASPPPQPPA